MTFPEIPNKASAFEQEPAPLFGGTLLFKSIEDGDSEDTWKFSGIASDEDSDVDGDKILKKSLDLTYANQRGYVNWDHRRDPEHQLGYLTKAVVIGKSEATELQKSYPSISETASVYVEGVLYKHLAKAQHVRDIMKSTPLGATGLGLSLDGSVAKDQTGGIVKAYVRGVAITPQPCQPKTLLQLRKSLVALTELEGNGSLADLPAAIANEVVSLLEKRIPEPVGLSHDQAVLWVLRKRPKWSYELANKLVSYTMDASNVG